MKTIKNIVLSSIFVATLVGIASILSNAKAQVFASGERGDSNVNIPQVSKKQLSAEQGKKESSIKTRDGNSGVRVPDHQKEVLTNPEISDIGRANIITGGGGNTAIINQDGDSNTSSVTQSGRDNYAKQTQSGRANDMLVNQSGDNNYSDENQVGEYNRKVKIQNGNREENTTTDEPDEENLHNED